MSRDINDLNPQVRVKCLAFLEQCRTAGHSLRVVQTWRSFEEQEALYAQGRWRPGPIVTDAKAGDSYHNYRMAFDVCFDLGSGKISWEGPWNLIGKLGKESGLDWGGDWAKPDRPHFEDKMGLTIDVLKSREYIPEVVDAEQGKVA